MDAEVDSISDLLFVPRCPLSSSIALFNESIFDSIFATMSEKIVRYSSASYFVDWLVAWRDRHKPATNSHVIYADPMTYEFLRCDVSLDRKQLMNVVLEITETRQLFHM
jgi:hypothetical protein